MYDEKKPAEESLGLTWCLKINPEIPAASSAKKTKAKNMAY